jgi:hypothetical protein
VGLNINFKLMNLIMNILSKLLFSVSDDNNLDCLETALTFWICIIPHIIDNLQHTQQSPNLRSTLADSLSNIGIHVFEKLGKQQLLIISVLTGCSYDDNSIVSLCIISIIES